MNHDTPRTGTPALDDGRAAEGRLVAPADVEAIHRPLARERHEPEEGREPAPWWVWGIVGVALFGGGFYLGRYSGPFGIESHVAYLPEGRPPPVVADEEAPPEGEEVYATSCRSCHQEGGTGVPGAFPPLVGSEWLQGDATVPILILLHGLQGPITVAGATYDGVMPAWRDSLTDAEIAAVLTYTRELAGAQTPLVEPEEVAALRKEFTRTTAWTADELRALGRGP